MTKSPFLVAYDYGMGALWAVIYAHEKSQIAVKYPMLKIVDTRPSWMTEDEYQRVCQILSLDVDAEPRGWLLSVVSRWSRP